MVGSCGQGAKDCFVENLGTMFASCGKLIGLADFVDVLVEGGSNGFAYEAAKDDAKSRRSDAVIAF